MSTAARHNSLSRKAFKNALSKNKSEGNVLRNDHGAAENENANLAQQEPIQPALRIDETHERSLNVKRLSRVLSSRRLSSSRQSMDERVDVPELNISSSTSPDKSRTNGDSMASNEKPILHNKLRNVSFLQEDRTVDDGRKKSPDKRAVADKSALNLRVDAKLPDNGPKPHSPPLVKSKSTGSVSTGHAVHNMLNMSTADSTAAPSNIGIKNRKLSVALKSRRYSTHLIEPNADSIRPDGISTPNIFHTGEYPSFDFSVADSSIASGAEGKKSPRSRESFTMLPEGARRLRSGSIILADGTRKSSFMQRLFGYVETEETKRRLRAKEESKEDLVPKPSSDAQAKTEDDETLLKMQSTIMNSDLYKLILAENEKKYEAAAKLPPSELLDYTSEQSEDSDTAACEDNDHNSKMEEENEEEDYMKLIASLNGIDAAPLDKEVWEVKYSTVGFNVVVGGAVNNDGVKAAAKLIKKAKLAVMEKEREEENLKSSVDRTPPQSPQKKKRKKKKVKDKHQKRPEMRRMSSVADQLMKTIVPLRIGKVDGDMPPPPEEEYESRGNALEKRLRTMSLSAHKFHSSEIDLEKQLKSWESGSEYESGSEDESEHVPTPEEQARLAHLEHIRKMKKDIWGRAAIFMKSNFSTNPKIIVMKEVAFERGVRLLETEFGDYSRKDKWEGLQSSRSKSDRGKLL